MKKTGNWIIILFIIAQAAFGAYLYYANVVQDTEPPVVSCETKEIKISVKDDEKVLLEGVTATDERSGDVSSTLVVEKISPLAAGKRIVTYAAVDKEGNVGRTQRELEYKDYKPAEIKLKKKLKFPVGAYVNPLEYVTAESVLDGDLTRNIKYTTASGFTTNVAGKYQVEFRVTDSAGTVSYLKSTIEMYNPSNK